MDGKPCRISSKRLRKFLQGGPPLKVFAISCPRSRCLYHFGKLIASSEEAMRRRSSIKSLRWTFRRDWHESETLPGPNVHIFTHLLPTITSFHLHLPRLADRPLLSIPESCLSQLTMLTISCTWRADFFAKVLQSCQNLKTLTLDFQSTVLCYKSEW